MKEYNIVVWYDPVEEDWMCGEADPNFDRYPPPVRLELEDMIVNFLWWMLPHDDEIGDLMLWVVEEIRSAIAEK